MKKWSEVAQSCLTFCDAHGHQAPPSMGFSRQEYGSRLPFPSPGNFPTQGSNPGRPHCRQTLYRLRHQGSHHEKASVRPPYLSAVSVSSGPQGFPGGSGGKESSCNVGDLGSIPGSGRSPGEGNGNPLQYSCLENLHGQRSLAAYSPWGHRESDTTEWLSTARQWSLTFWPRTVLMKAFKTSARNSMLIPLTQI